MSGGSMNYLYSKIDIDANFDTSTPERKAFAKHLKLVSKALHDIEWVDSSDYGEGDEDEAIRKCIGNSAILESAIEQANQALFDLQSEITRAENIKAKS